MPRRTQSMAIVIGLLVLAAAVAAIWILVKLIGLQASLVWTGVVGFVAWSVRSSVEQKREYQRLLADRKRQQYQEFLTYLERAFVEVRAESGMSSRSRKAGRPAHGTETHAEDLATELRRWSMRLTLVGSDEVIRAFNLARAAAIESPDATARTSAMKQWAILWLAMRKDCGHPDTALGPSDMLASFVNDIDEYRDAIDK